MKTTEREIFKMKWYKMCRQDGMTSADSWYNLKRMYYYLF